MAMGTVAGRGLRSEINVTPLVDVVLVLLIIFMVVIPILQMGHPVSTPPESAMPVVVPPADQLIVRMEKGPHYFLNKEEVPLARLAVRLGELTRNHGNRKLFFAADGELPYGDVATFMDFCRSNGASNLGIVFDDLRPAG